MALSKSMSPSKEAWIHNLTCEETIHRGVPTCRAYFITLFTSAIVATYKLYTPLYLVTALLSGKLNINYLITRLIPDISRSSLAIALHGSTFGYFTCWTSYFFKQRKFAYILSALMAATVAISVERKARRPELAVYVGNHTTECIYRMLLARGYIKPVRAGEEWLFFLGYSVLIFYYYFKKQYLPSSMSGLFKILFGTDLQFQQPKLPERTIFSAANTPRPGAKTSEPKPDLVERKIHEIFQKTLKGKINKTLYEALRNSASGFARASLAGILLRFSLSFIPALFGIFKKNGLAKLPAKFKEALLRDKTLKFGAFLGLISGVTKFILTIAYDSYIKQAEAKSSFFNGDDKEEPISIWVTKVSALKLLSILGGVGTSLLLARSLLKIKSSEALSNELMMYLLSKAGEACFWDYGVRKLGIPVWKHGDSLLYIIGCTILFYASVYEPQCLRVSYWDFLMRMSDGYFYDATKGAEVIRNQLGPNVNVVDNYWKKLFSHLTPSQKIRDLDLDHYYPPPHLHDLSEL